MFVLDRETLMLMNYLENLGFNIVFAYRVDNEIYVFTDKKVPKEIVKQFKNVYFYYISKDYTELIKRYFYNHFGRNPYILTVEGKIYVINKISEKYFKKFIPLIQYLENNKIKIKIINPKTWKVKT